MTKRVLLISGLAVLALGGALYGRRIVHRLFGHQATKSPNAGLYDPSKHLFKRGRPNGTDVCLTIDDGPHPSLHRILPILKRYGAHATFFMVGSRLAASPILVREVLADGNEVGNHTQTHDRLPPLPLDRVRSELSDCEAAFEAATGGRKMTLFRPPGMDSTPEIFKVAAEFGYVTVWWNYGAKDYILKTGGPNETIGKGHIAESILKQVKPGGIILLHDSEDTADALPAILEGLKAKGLAVKDASEMLAELPEPVIVKSNAGEFASDAPPPPKTAKMRKG